MQKQFIFLLRFLILFQFGYQCNASVKNYLDNSNNFMLNIENVKKQLFLNGNFSTLKNSFGNHVFDRGENGLRGKYNDIKCLGDLNQVQKSLKEFEPWAINLLDSWGKLPSGILSGNFFEFGGFAQCLRIQHKIRPQYCLGQLVIDLESIMGSRSMNNKKFIFTQRHRNVVEGVGIHPRIEFLPESRPGHAINIGLCIPDSCAPLLIETFLADRLSAISNLSIKIPNNYCQIEENYSQLKTADILTIVLLVTIFCLIVASTIYDVMLTIKKKQKNQVFIVFSFYTNGEKVFSCKNSNSADMMHCLHGIRAMSTAWVLYGHTYLMFLMMPTRNSGDYLTFISQYHNMFIAAAPISVDTFFVLSGLLVSITMLKHLEKSKGKMNILLIYFHRFLRLTPLLAITILFSCTLLKFFGNGPIWPHTIEFLGEQCDRWWWTTLLYVQNYVNPTDICLGHTWYLAVDTQLFIIAPILIYLTYRYKLKFVFVMCILVLGCVSGTIGTFVANDLGANQGKQSQKMVLTYYPTHIRFSPWLIGVIFGYILFDLRNKKMGITKLTNYCAWIISLAMMLTVIFSDYPLQQPTNHPLPVEFGLYESLSRVAWSLALCYIIFACIHNYGGPVNWFLSLPLWQPISRLSYAIYLIHFPVIIVMMATLKTSLYFSEANALHAFIGNYGITFIVSVIASLAFESPVVALEKIIFSKQLKPTEQQHQQPYISKQSTEECNGVMVDAK